MSAVIRGWLGFAALGAGLVHLALAIDSSLAFGIPLVVVGAAEFAWGVFAFTRPALPLARTARVAAVVPILGWVALLVVGAAGAFEGLRVLPMLVASLLDLAIAVGITWILRRDPAHPAVPLRRAAICSASAPERSSSRPSRPSRSRGPRRAPPPSRTAPTALRAHPPRHPRRPLD